MRKIFGLLICFAALMFYFLLSIHYSLGAAMTATTAPAAITTASDYKALEKAAENGDKQALVQLQAAANSDIAKAQDALGVYYYSKKDNQNVAAQGYVGWYDAQDNLYYNGRGMKQDYTQAFNWFHKAAEQDNAVAEDNLGVLYCNGQGTKQNYTQAFNWFQASAIQGYTDGEDDLGYLFENGLGTKQDYTQALNWYQIAAAQGDVDACQNLSIMYSFGQGVAVDQQKAQYWADLAKQLQGNGN